MSKLRTALTRIKRSSTKTPLFFVEFAVPRTFVVEKGLVNAIDGLVAIHVVVRAAPSNSTLITYWETAAHYDVGKTRFRTLTGLTAAPLSSGLIGDLQVVKPPVLKRFSLYVVILSLAALLGALDALHNRYAAFFGYPKAHILFVTEEDHLRIVAENKGLVALRIVNLSQSVSVLAHFEEAILYQADQINRVPETVIRIPDLVVPVDTGDADTVELYVSNPPPPGRYWISVTALMKGGLVWGRETITVVRDIGVFGKIGRNRIRNAGVRCSNHLSGTILRIAATGYLRKPQRIHPESNVSAGDRV